MTPGGGRGAALVVAAALALAPPAGAADPGGAGPAASGRAYELSAEVDPDRGIIAGTMRIDYRHDGRHPAPTLVFLLAPNRLAVPPDLPVERLDARFPEGFEPADLSIRDVRGGDGEPLPYGIDGMRLTVFLPRPLSPGERTSVAMRFVTTVPVARGLAGRLGGALRVQGGWHPLLAVWAPAEEADARAGWRLDRLPPEAGFVATLRAPAGVTVVSGGRRRPADPGAERDATRGADAGGGRDAGTGPVGAGPVTLRLEAVARYLPLVAARGLRLVAAEAGPVRLEAYAGPRNARRAARALALAAGASRLFRERHPEPPDARPGTAAALAAPIRLVEAPLAVGLVAGAEDVILFDPMLGKIFPWLRPFHGRQVVYRVYEALWRRHLLARGVSPPPWVVEALAVLETEATGAALTGPMPRLERTARKLAFIPIVDEFLHSGRVPNRQIYRPALEIAEDPADLGRLDAPALPGWRIVRKLEALAGARAVSSSAAAYAADPVASDFVTAVSAAAGRDLAPLVREWIEAPRAVDYAVEVGPSRRVPVGAADGAPGPYETTIRLRARPPPEAPPGGLAAAVPAAEAVPVVVSLRRGTIRRVAESTAGERWTIRSERPVKVVEVDPDEVTEDRWRADNRVPRRWRYLLTQLSVALDIRQEEAEFRVAGRASRAHGGGPTFGASLFRDQESAGLSASVGYGLGEWPPGGRHGIGLTASYERLDPGFGNVDPSARRIVTLRGGYGFDSRYDGRHPLSGRTARVDLTWSDGLFGSDADYLLASVGGTAYLRVAPNHAVALRLEIGETISGTAPFGKSFLLGGSEGLRAYPKDAFGGRSLSLGAVEYRFPIADLDRWILGLVGTQGVSGVVALEAGQTADDHVPFRLDRYRAGVSLGLRLAVRLLGVSPSLAAVDVAMPIDDGPEPGEVQVYLSASHTF